MHVPNNNQPDNVQGSEPGTNPPNSSTPETPPPAPPAPAPTPQVQAKPSGKVIPMTADSLRNVEKSARDKGARQAKSEADRRAKALGYESYDAMIATLEAEKRGQPVPTKKPQQQQQNRQPQQQQQRNDRPNNNRNDREMERLRADNQRLTKSLNGETRKRRQTEREKAQLEADMILREAAIRAGIKDVDYALHLLKQDMKAKTDEERKSFDETAYFSGLRESRPFLFGVEKKPASTTPTPKPAPTPAADTAPAGGPPPEGEKPNGGGDSKDAREMTQEAYHKRLRQLGITPN